MSKVRLITALFLLCSWHSSSYAMKCLPIYGNWCGPDHPHISQSPPPVDEFDAACMRHDICTSFPADDTVCDIRFVNELRGLSAKYGYLPRPLQWAEYAIRVKAGDAPWNGMPMPTPMDALGFMSSITAPCY